MVLPFSLYSFGEESFDLLLVLLVRFGSPASLGIRTTIDYRRVGFQFLLKWSTILFLLG